MTKLKVKIKNKKLTFAFHLQKTLLLSNLPLCNTAACSLIKTCIYSSTAISFVLLLLFLAGGSCALSYKPMMNKAKGFEAEDAFLQITRGALFPSQPHGFTSSASAAGPSRDPQHQEKLFFPPQISHLFQSQVQPHKLDLPALVLGGLQGAVV